jgi:hypothetical protein
VPAPVIGAAVPGAGTGTGETLALGEGEAGADAELDEPVLAGGDEPVPGEAAP